MMMMSIHLNYTTSRLQPGLRPWQRLVVRQRRVPGGELGEDDLCDVGDGNVGPARPQLGESHDNAHGASQREGSCAYAAEGVGLRYLSACPTATADAAEDKHWNVVGAADGVAPNACIAQGAERASPCVRQVLARAHREAASELVERGGQVLLIQLGVLLIQLGVLVRVRVVALVMPEGRRVCEQQKHEQKQGAGGRVFYS